MKNLSLLFILLFVALILQSNKTFAQNISDAKARKYNTLALKHIEKYGNSFRFKRSRDYTRFQKLFTSPKNKIFNDILPDNSLDSLVSVNAYLDLVDKYYESRIRVSVIPYDISPIKIIGDKKGTITILASKIYGGKTKDRFVYADTLNVKFVLTIDFRRRKVLIDSILPIKDYGKYCIISAGLKGKKKLSNDSLLINGRNIMHLDANGQCLLKRISDTNVVVIESTNDDLLGRHIINEDFINNNKSCLKTGDKNIRCIEFRYSKISFGITAGYSPINLSYTNQDNSINSVFTTTSNYNIGLDIGILLSLNNRISIVTGIYYKHLPLEVGVSAWSDHYNSTDTVGSDYYRTDSVYDFNESLELNYLSIPLGIQKVFRIKNTFLIKVAIGGNIYYNLSSGNSIEAKGYYAGRYPDLYNVTIDENGYYDYGKFPLSDENNANVNTMLYSAYAIFGIGYLLNRKTEIYLTSSYNYGLTPVFKGGENYLSKKSNEINSSTSVLGKVYLRELFLNLNINYKL